MYRSNTNFSVHINLDIQWQMAGFPKLVNPEAKAVKTLFGPILSTNPSVHMA